MRIDVSAMPARCKGLTLIELLVAITVLAIIAVLGWRGLDSIIRARVALTSDLEQTRGMQLAFAQLQSDCSHLASDLPISFHVSQGRLTMVRKIFADNQPQQLQVIAYRVRGGRLSRSESAVTRDLTELDTMWFAALGDAGADQSTLNTSNTGVVLQSGVAELKMRLWFEGSWHAPDSPAPARGITGLEVASFLQGQEGSLLKIFLLGAG